MVRTQIQLTERQSHELHRRAKLDGISVAEIIRQSIDETLSKPRIEDETRKRDKVLVGTFYNTGDDSDQYKGYFVEAILDHIK